METIEITVRFVDMDYNDQLVKVNVDIDPNAPYVEALDKAAEIVCSKHDVLDILECE